MTTQKTTIHSLHPTVYIIIDILCVFSQFFLQRLTSMENLVFEL